MFGLPSSREIGEIGRRVSWRLDFSLVPSVDDFASRLRLKGRGQRIGHVDAGVLRDIDYAASIIKGELRYRDSRTAPQRKIRLLLDLSAKDDVEAANRLCAISVLVAAALLSSPATQITLQPFGLRELIRPHTLQSVGNVSFIEKSLREALRFSPDPHLTLGKLRFAAGDVSRHHLVLLTHYVSPEMLRGFFPYLGMSTILVAPSSGVARQGLAGETSGVSKIQLDAVVLERYRAYRERVWRRLGEVVVVHRRGSASAAFLEAFGVGDVATNESAVFRLMRLAGRWLGL